MSVKAMAWVFESSPYTLAARLVHLAIADIANEDNDWLVWVSQSKIAKKAKVSRGTVISVLHKMVDEGAMEVVEKRPGGVTVYRMIWSGGCTKADTPCAIYGTKPARSTAPAPIVNSNRNEKGLALARPTDDPLVRCAHALTVLAFEQSVKPELREGGNGAFPAVLKLIERLLRSGKSQAEIKNAILQGVEVWTLAGLQTTIAQTKSKRADPMAGRHERTLDEEIRQAMGDDQ